MKYRVNFENDHSTEWWNNIEVDNAKSFLTVLIDLNKWDKYLNESVKNNMGICNAVHSMLAIVDSPQYSRKGFLMFEWMKNWFLHASGLTGSGPMNMYYWERGDYDSRHDFIVHMIEWLTHYIKDNSYDEYRIGGEDKGAKGVSSS